MHELECVVTHAPVCMLLVGREGMIRVANSEAERLFGWSVQELVGSSVELLLPEASRGVHVEHRRLFERAPTTRTMGPSSLIEARHRDGRVFPVDVMLVPWGDRSEFLAVIVERADVRKPEETRCETTMTLRRLMERVQDVIYVVRFNGDPTAGQVETVSDYVEKVVGYTAHEFKNDPRLWLRNIHSDDLEAVERTTDEMVRERTSVRRVYRMRHKDSNQWRIMEDRATPLLDEAGAVVGICGAARDITDQKQVEGQLIMTERLAAIGTLAASLAHELNNPLTCVLLALDRASVIAERGSGTIGDVIAELSDVRAGVDQMRGVLQDLRGLASPDVRPYLVDPRRVMDLAVRLASASLRGRAVLERRYGDVPSVRADESRLAQVFLNLLVNAAHAISDERGGKITVRIHTDPDGHAIVEVEDDGVGISSELLPRVFEPFYTTKARGEGTGLGLFVSKRIIDDIGGEISIESQTGRGTVVRVALPLGKARQ